MSHRNKFENFLKKEKLPYEIIDLDDSSIGFKMYESIDNGPRLILAPIFKSNDFVVDIKIYNISNITNPLKKENYLSLFNDVYRNNRFIRFVINDEDSIYAEYSMLLPDIDYDYSQEIFDLLILLLRQIEEIFPKIMRLQWS